VTVTNTTAQQLDLPGATIPANGTVEIDDSRYLNDANLRKQVNDLVAAGTLTATNTPPGFPVPIGAQTDTAPDNVFDSPVFMPGLPTSAAGLPSGQVWSNAGVLNVAP
jgi:hypothetical protein